MTVLEQKPEPQDALINAHKSVPHNLEAEQALLGALLVDNRQLEKIGDFIKAADFYAPVHQRIFTAITRIIDKGMVADAMTLKNYFEQDSDLSEAGGADYLADLTANVVTTMNTEHYGRVLHDLFLRRALIDVGEETIGDAYESDLDVSATDQIQKAEGKLYELATQGDFREGFIDMKTSITNAIALADRAFKTQGQVTGVTTGLSDMDKKLGGLQDSDLLILAGRPSMGKTALATNIAYNAAKSYYDTGGKEGAVVGFFSLEMSADQLATRVLASAARVPGDKIRRGDVEEADFRRFVEASQLLTEVPLFIDDSPGLSISQVRTRARRLKRQHGLGLLVVDYLQLLRGTGSKQSENRVLEVSEITRGLKGIAKELQIPVMALSQLSRMVENRDDKRPQLSDLRESGSIEQDADVVMFVYREQYYLERAEPQRKPEEDDSKFNDRYQQWQDRLGEVHNTGECIVAKQRHGPIGSVRMFFDGPFTQFSDLDTHHSE